MTAAARPRRPLPARVYWVRRLLLLGVVAGVVTGAAMLLGVQVPDPRQQAAPVAGEPSPTASASPTLAPPSDAAEAAAGGRNGGETVSGQKESGQKESGQKESGQKEGGQQGSQKKGGKKKEPLAEPSGPCTADDIVARPRVVGDAYAGRLVRFRVELTTRTSPACTWTASAQTLVVSLTSGDDRIWTSQECPAGVQTSAVVVRKAVPADVAVRWRGQRSDKTCSRTTFWAEPGWYHVQAAAYGADPSDVQFELKKPLRPTITAQPTQKSKKAARD